MNSHRPAHPALARLSQQTHLTFLLAIILATAIIAGLSGYLLGASTDYTPQRLQSHTCQPTPTKPTGWISPTTRAVKRATATPYPLDKLTIKSQSVSPDKRKMLTLSEPESLVADSPQIITISDTSSGDNVVVLNVSFGGGVFSEFTTANWSFDSAYVFAYMGFIEGGDLYVFKANGKPFANGKTYLLASELGYTQRPLIARWKTNTQIRLDAYPQGPVAEDKTNAYSTYSMDVENETMSIYP